MELRTPQEIAIMAEGGRRLGALLLQLKKEVRPGITTLALDAAARAIIVDGGDVPAFLNYRPEGARRAYPYTLCASVNDVVVHGQPSSYVLREGDIIKLDLGLRHEGFYLDAAITVGVGNISAEAKKLIAVTEESMYAGIKEATPGRSLGDIGYAIERVVRKNRFSIAEGLTGHGIGRNLHEEEPIVFNFGDRGTGMKLVPGMVIAIEPMVTIGGGAIVQLRDEGYGTVDKTWAAHFEHTVAVTERGPMILTKA